MVSLLPFQEVVNPLSAGPVFSLPLSDGNFTSLIHSTFDNVSYLFAGTHNGKIYQVCRKYPPGFLSGLL